MFMHADISHLFFNMFALWMFGRIVEYDLGSRRFLLYYLVCGMGAGLIQLGVQSVEWSVLAAQGVVPQSLSMMRVLYSTTIGASGAVFGILLAYGMIHPNNVIMLMFPPIALKAKWFVVIYGAVELFAGVAGTGGTVAHFAHLGGMLFGWLLLRYWKKKREIFY
jgi:membrane associated rhomboid family serine protease